MASSGSFQTSSYSNRSVLFEWWLNSQDISNNKSNIGWRIKGAGSYSGWITSGNFKVKILGNQVYYSSDRIRLYTGTIIASGSYDIHHNNDGNKSFDAYVEAGIYYVAVNCSGSGSWSLPSIPRQANITGANNFNDEQNPYLTFNNAGGFQINARLEFGGVQIQRDNIPNTGNYTFSLTNAERDLLLSKCTANSMAVRYMIATKLNGNETWWSWLDKTMTVVNANPIFEDFIYEDENPITTNVTKNNQVLIRGQSKLKVIIPSQNKMVAVKQASNKNYVAIIDDKNASVNYSETDVIMDLSIPTSFGTKRLSVRAYDSRNNSTVVYKDIQIYDYSIPTININIQRLNNFENETTLSVTGTYSPLFIEGVNKNSIVKNGIMYRYREIGASQWNNWNELIFNMNEISGTYSCNIVNLSLDNTKSFEFEVTCIDKITNFKASKVVDVGVPLLFIAKEPNAVGIGKIPNEAVLDVAGNGNFVTECQKYRYIRVWQNGSTSNSGNHIVSVMAYEVGGNIDICRSKNVTTNGVEIINEPLMRITNGINNTDDYGSMLGGIGRVYAEIDLEKEYDIEKVRVWRYFGDNRIYHETAVEVISEDRSITKSLHNYTLDEEYAEDDSGIGRTFVNTDYLEVSLNTNGLANTRGNATFHDSQAEEWATPALKNGWVNWNTNTNGEYHNPSFRKVNGIVYIRGLIKNGRVGSSCFTLPVGYRPSKRLIFSTIGDNAIFRLDVAPNGEVIPLVGNNLFVSLDNISFFAEQ